MPLHDNFCDNSQRYKFNKCLEEVSKLQPNISSLMLKKLWNPTDVTFSSTIQGDFEQETAWCATVFQSRSNPGRKAKNSSVGTGDLEV